MLKGEKFDASALLLTLLSYGGMRIIPIVMWQKETEEFWH